MSRIKRGLALTRKSWEILRANPSLLQFAIFGGIATTFAAIITIGPGLYLIEEGEIAPGAPLVVIGLYLLAGIGIYFNVGLAAAADRILRGQEATLADGLAVSRARLGQIAAWTAFSTTVGLVLNLLEDGAGAFGQILGRLLDVGWSLITFLAFPVIAIEGPGAWSTLKRSSSLFRERWGQQVTGNVAIGGIVILLGVLPGIVMMAVGIGLWTSGTFAGAALAFVGLILLLLAILIQRSMSGIFGVALYRYAVDGETLATFTAEDMENVARPRGGSEPARSSI